MKTKYYTARDIVRHVDLMAAMFPAMAGDMADAWDKLQRLEKRAARHALRGCNGPEWPSEEAEEAAGARILDAVDRVLGFRAAGVPVFLNGDPRGYSLKIDFGDKFKRPEGFYTDMGGYGIIAPEFKQ